MIWVNKMCLKQWIVTILIFSVIKWDDKQPERIGGKEQLEVYERSQKALWRKTQGINGSQCNQKVKESPGSQERRRLKLNAINTTFIDINPIAIIIDNN